MGTKTREEILRQATELRRKQDARADGPLRGSTAILGGFLTIATIANTLLVAPALQADATQLTAGIVIALAVTLASGLCWFVIQARPMGWHDGPDIDRLRPNDDHGVVLDHLVDTLMIHYRRNEATIRRLRFWLGLQAVITLAGICVLIAAVLLLR